ncbi:glycosyltransferase family 1 protein [Bradyrhizobium genosp. L]|uniref:glycosyltransferase n=1 Tax=Bradyrhizobium genosp. L TaxID=83637 RepID=UPI0018A290B4|nr:glycosyltransferase [Bradyrhizobium genosp. L]QPF86550.1 glycosyltransferase family 1 protein [Bradyrhizobium genosp. L]
MGYSPVRTATRPKIAVCCFIPDYGHLQPLLKIADALREQGFEIKCYIAEECRPLLQRFQFDCFTLNSTDRLKRRKEMTRAFGRSTFFNSVCLYLHYLMMYPRIVAEVGNSAASLSDELTRQQPDLIICDTLWFTDWYARIAQSLGINIVLNSFDGSLAYNQRPFVQTYGITDAPQFVQSAFEVVSAISTKLCASYYRLRFLRTWLGVRRRRRAAKAQFDAAFPLDGAPPIKTPDWLVVGTASTERQRLGTVLRLDGADRSEIPALRFRSSAPIPPELEGWIDSGDHPVVYVSFGSAVDLDATFVRAIYQGLRGLDARVLWSLPDSQRGFLSGVPEADNIRIERFVPQPEILAMAKVRCFVTQGGPHSIQEALFGATPMLCIPFFVDQAYNSSVVERLGVGRRLWRKDVSAKTIGDAVKGILADASCSRNIIEISEDLSRHEGGEAVATYVAQFIKRQPTLRQTPIEVFDASRNIAWT